MKATFWQRGEAIDYKNETASVIKANTVITGKNIVGVVGSDIAPGETGSLHVAGVFEMQKKASETIEFGASVYFDATKEEITATASGNVAAGYATATATADATTVLVKLLG